MKQSGRECSVLEVLEGMKQEIFSRREHKAGKEWLPYGKHSGSLEIPDGRRVPEGSQVDLCATIRSVVESGRPVREEQGGLLLSPRDLRLKRFRRKKQVCILFLVDASRSQGSMERLSFAKSAVLAVLEQAYSDRDRVGMVVFGNRKAEVVLSFTKSVDFAAGRMEKLKAKGNTPLAMGIRKSVEILEAEKRKSPDETVILVMLTDGKSNFDTRDGKPVELVLSAARDLRKKEIPVLVIDTENSVFGMGLARRIADASGAEYVKL